MIKLCGRMKSTNQRIRIFLLRLGGLILWVRIYKLISLDYLSVVISGVGSGTALICSSSNLNGPCFPIMLMPTLMMFSISIVHLPAATRPANTGMNRDKGSCIVFHCPPGQ
uniref:Uncharacterized protein n=1 Tax=Spongospora subterranea TaxID=70186 RepID=A0A0H5QMQ4_9EUKA|eukprot:CRZ03439.1 hypothetical protein [Spongospora subterranea]